MNVVSCTLDIVVDDKTNHIDVKEITRIDKLRLNDQLCDAASNIAFYGLLHSKSKAMADRMEWMLKKTKAEVGLQERALSRQKLTEGQVESLVETNAKVIEAYGNYHKAREHEMSFYSFLMSLLAMKELMITLSANIRAEQKLDGV